MPGIAGDSAGNPRTKARIILPLGDHRFFSHFAHAGVSRDSVRFMASSQQIL